MDLLEQLLLEKSRQELISKSQNADIVKAYGTTRWDRRNNVNALDTVRNYNSVDFNSLFKGSLLNLIIPIKGETNDYSVEVLFEGVCEKIQAEMKRNNYKIEYKVIYRALINAINASDLLVSCTCDDWKYRQAFQSTKGRYNAGRPELRPANITNPNDTKGAGCKHVMNVLGNLDWAMKLAVCINNYILYMRDNYENLFAEIIWPAISGMTYDEAYQTGLFDDLANTMPTLDSEGQYGEVDTTEIDIINDLADQKGQREPDTKSDRDSPDVPNINKAALEAYYIKDNHTREETAQRFHLTDSELDTLLTRYNLRKREAD